MKPRYILAGIGTISLLYVGSDIFHRTSLRGVNQCVLNDGIVFGIDLIPINLVYFLSILLIGTVIWLFLNKLLSDLHEERLDDEHLSEYVFYSLILSGGIVNMYERALYGNICDYISMPLYGPLMVNMSDIFVTVGVLGILRLYLKRMKEEGEINFVPAGFLDRWK